mmetsp:Transcript_13667/g.34303  ORF Transcript_13667/g.34303 Transcript_13667/m.34303 type:complete len:92 (+) Transcript_13667:22-297(+)
MLGAAHEGCGSKGWGKRCKGKGKGKGWKEWKGRGKGHGCGWPQWTEGASTPEYEAEVDQLVGMGFENRELNQELLARHGGKVEEVIRVLLE